MGNLEPRPFRHSDGSLVYGWDELVAVAGVPVPKALDPKRPPSFTAKQDRGRANRYQKQP